MNFTSQIFFSDINHGYGASILKKNCLWLLPFYMIVATDFCYEKVHRTMRTAIVSNFLNTFMIYNELKASLRNHHDKVARRHAVDWQGNTWSKSVIPTKLLLCNFIEITLQHGCSPQIRRIFSKTPLKRNSSNGLLPIHLQHTQGKY